MSSDPSIVCKFERELREYRVRHQVPDTVWFILTRLILNLAEMADHAGQGSGTSKAKSST